MDTFLLFLVLAYLATIHAQELTFEIMEELPPGLLGNIANKANLTSVLGIQELSTLQYTVVEDSSGGEKPFAVDQSSGNLYTNVSFDREKLCGSAAICTVKRDIAVQSSSPESAFFRKFSVVVYVIDRNDNAPQFSQSSYNLDISEKVAVDTTFPLPSATDVDADEQHKVKRYTIDPTFSEFDLRVVRLDNRSGDGPIAVALKVLKPLDREKQGQFAMSLKAYDGGVPEKTATLPISVKILDENDNAPVFEHTQYNRKLAEDTPVNSTALTVVARDLDEGENGRVSYFLSDNSDAAVRSLFAVDQTTGAVEVKSSLGTRGGNTFDFEIIAKDSGSPQLTSICRVVIQVEDNRNDKPEIKIKPLFSQSGAAVVPESAAIGRVTALLTVMDHDSGRNGLVTCELDNKFFSLQKLELNEYKVIVAQQLDRETYASHIVVIRCRDGGSPSLSTEEVLKVDVSDSNDNMPVFTRNTYSLTVDENEVVGTLVGTITAMDKDAGDNARLIYGIENNGDTFTIDTMLGDIYTTRFLDREAKPTYDFSVFAWDSSPVPLTATATVVVNIRDKNDLKPVFSNKSYHFYVQERAPVGTVIGHVVATDGDFGLNAQLEYYMVTSRPHPRMPVGVNSSGALMVSGEVDFESASVYSFVVTAIDLGSPPQNSTVPVLVTVVDKNDHSPVITFPSADNPSVTIGFDTPPGAEVAKVVAYDLDSGANGDLRYSITVVNSSTVFLIDDYTGVISLGPQILSMETRTYSVVVSVRDNGVPQMAQQALLRIDVASTEFLLQGNTNMKIVIALVCVTLSLAVTVLTTLLCIRYFDRRRCNSVEKHKHQILTKSDCHSDDFEKDVALGKTTTVFTPMCEQGSLVVDMGGKSTKKSVTFEKDRRSINRQEEVTEQTVRKPTRESYPLDNSHVVNFTTFKPPPRPHSSLEQPRPCQGASHERERDVIHLALRQHNALVRSIRGAHPPSYCQTSEHAEKDEEVWSRSSAETTSDSGHGGSELDVSVVKANV